MTPGAEGAGHRGRYSFNCFNHSTHLGLAPSLPTQVAAAAGAGYDHIGLDVPSLLAHEAAGLPPEAIGDAAASGGVPCFELVPLPIGTDQSANDGALATVARLARAVGARHVLATARAPLSDDLARGFRQAADHLVEGGVALSVEFMANSPLATLEQAVALLDLVDHPNLGVVLDSWHACLSGTRWETIEGLPLESIDFVQLDDAPPGASGSDLHDSLHRRLLPGEGILPLIPFRDLLVAKGFDGVVSVEVLSGAWRDEPIRDFAAATLAAAVDTWERVPAPSSQTTT